MNGFNSPTNCCPPMSYGAPVKAFRDHLYGKQRHVGRFDDAVDWKRGAQLIPPSRPSPSGDAGKGGRRNPRRSG